MNRTDYTQPSRVRNAPLTAQTDLARVRSWDAMRQAAPTREAKEARAKAYSASLSLIEKQCRPFGGLMDTGRKNPAERELDAINGALAAGIEFWDAIAVPRWILRKLGCRVTLRGAAIEIDHNQVAADFAERAGRLVATWIRAHADGVVDLQERQELQRELEFIFRAAIGMEAAAEVGVQ